MAVPINDVYQTVLTILNKEQRGYLDPEEFNRMAVLVQREIFEGYFNKGLSVPESEDPLLNPSDFSDEKISYFEIVADLDENTGDKPNPDSGFFSWPQQGDTDVNGQVLDDLNRLGLVTDRDNGVVLEATTHKDIAWIQQSPLTWPTKKQSYFVVHNGGIQVHPNGKGLYGNPDIFVDKISMVYMKDPVDPVWAYDTEIFEMSNEIEYDEAASKDFDMHPSEFSEIVVKICAYAGVIVRAQDVTQFAQGEEQKIMQTEQ